MDGRSYESSATLDVDGFATDEPSGQQPEHSVGDITVDSVPADQGARRRAFEEGALRLAHPSQLPESTIPGEIVLARIGASSFAR